MKRLALGLLPLALCLSGCDCGGRTHPPEEEPCVGDACDPPCTGDECTRCEDDPRAVECPCGPDDVPAPCYSGDRETASVGVCQVGLQSCRDGRWTGCEGEILPSAETCDLTDNDCDGTVDDGVLGPCGDCSRECSELSWGHEPGETPFAPDASNSSGVGLRDPGALVLLGDQVGLRVLWVANSPDGTVSLIDTGLRTERARYRTGPDATSDDPSRTSVGYLGHAYIANRASYGSGGPGEGAVIKILEHDCPDRDGDGVVETSGGRDDVLDWGEDECVEWRTVLDGAVRAVAAQVKQEGGRIQEVVWAGTTYEHRFVELDAETGEPTGLEAQLPTCNVYGAALAPDGQMWVSCFFSSGFARFDTNDPTDVEELATASPYGIAVGPDGRVWMSDGHVYDPAERAMTTIPGAYGRGVATDASGSAWIGECGSGTCRIDGETLALETFDMASRGIAVDFDGFVWGVPQWGSPQGSVTVLDPEDEQVETVLDDCDGPCLTNPYTYSDMTGTQLLAVMTPLGSWETIVEGCGPDELTRWVRVSWDADLPVDTTLRVQVRAANDLGTLAAQPWQDVATDPPDESPVAIEEALGEHQGSALLGLRLVLGTATHGETPVVHRMAVHRGCGSVFR